MGPGKKRSSVYAQMEDSDSPDDACGFVCFIIGLFCMFLVVGVIATLIVLGVDDRHNIESLTSTRPARALSSGIMESIHSSFKTRDNAKPGVSEKVDLLVLVRSLPENLAARNTIRMTWKDKTPPAVEVLFVIPARAITSKRLEVLEEEKKEHQDMLIFLDGPVVPESESLLLELIWVTRNRNFLYLMKTRDSMYVRLEVLMKEVISSLVVSKSNVYLGYFQGRQKPGDKASLKHSEPQWFLCDLFIRFAHSGGYVLSKELVNRVASVASVLFPYNNEDVALGTWLSPYDDVNWTHTIRFDTEIGKPRGCRNDLLVFQPTDMVEQHNRLQNGADVCVEENSKLETYQYNFNIAPSKCCSAVKF